jgi:hypothetical protein
VELLPKDRNDLSAFLNYAFNDKANVFTSQIYIEDPSFYSLVFDIIKQMHIEGKLFDSSNGTYRILSAFLSLSGVPTEDSIKVVISKQDRKKAQELAKVSLSPNDPKYPYHLESGKALFKLLVTHLPTNADERMKKLSQVFGSEIVSSVNSYGSNLAFASSLVHQLWIRQLQMKTNEQGGFVIVDLLN